MRAALFVTGLLFGVLSTCEAVARKSADQAADTAELLIVVQPSEVEIRGAVSSSANEIILRGTAENLHADRTPAIDVAVQTALPPVWSLVTNLTLQALANTKSATAAVRPGRISIRGFTEDRAAWQQAASRIANLLPAGWEMDHQVEGTPAAGAMNRQCIELFRTANRGRAVEFGRGSAELGTAAMPLLDELIQIAVDCPGSRIDIVGHTDNTGDESANLALSRERASAVASYLVARGIPAARIRATGLGSSRPLVDESTTRARQLNRRIELSLAFPEEK